MKKISLVLLIVLMMISISACSAKINKVSTSDTLYVKKVEDVSKDFVKGMDASSVIALEKAGVKYYTQDGINEDAFQILAENGINYIRVRVWNNPYDTAGNGYGGGNCDINTALEIGKRATKYGMKLYVDFHYSDFWADPSKQMCPKAWANMTVDEKKTALYDYTYDSIKLLLDNDVKVGIVSIGNETTSGLAGETNWKNICGLLAEGAKAVRKADKKILIAIHVTDPEKEGSYLSFAKKFEYYAIDYDIFASSYYPYWHGTFENLAKVLNEINTKYHKKTLIAETSYAYTSLDSDFYGNIISDSSAYDIAYPFTVQGQANYIRDLIDLSSNKITDCLGIVYWEGTWISSGGVDYDSNKFLWEKYGTGWATSYAKEYDPKDAGKYYGGCAVDNQAFFDDKGKALESLKVFSLVNKGNVTEIKADAIKDTRLTFDLAGDITLPTTVNAIMSDGSLSVLPVVWEEINFDELKTGGAKKWTFTGKAGGMDATLLISMMEFNYLKNYSFEEDSNKTKIPSGWMVEDLSGGKIDELFVETKSTDSMTGENHFHFWSGTSDTVEFKLSQEVSGLEAGTYKFSISLMGGDVGAYTANAFVLINGIEVKSDDMSITSYGTWDTALISDILVNGGDKLTIGIYIKCSGSGAGAWGKIDDALLNRIS